MIIASDRSPKSMDRNPSTGKGHGNSPKNPTKKHRKWQKFVSAGPYYVLLWAYPTQRTKSVGLVWTNPCVI